MALNFSIRNQANGRMNFDTRRIKYIKAFTHWVHDFYLLSCLPSIVGLSEVTFKPQLDRAYTRADIRKSTAKKKKELDGCGIAGIVGERKTVETLGRKVCQLYQISHRSKRRTIIIRHTRE